MRLRELEKWAVPQPNPIKVAILIGDWLGGEFQLVQHRDQPTRGSVGTDLGKRRRAPNQASAPSLACRGSGGRRVGVGRGQLTRQGLGQHSVATNTAAQRDHGLAQHSLVAADDRSGGSARRCATGRRELFTGERLGRHLCMGSSGWCGDRIRA